MSQARFREDEATPLEAVSSLAVTANTLVVVRVQRPPPRNANEYVHVVSELS